ncbi:reverse transcriptase [Phytophthora megakarya]|uniref:Reverse transcriptase n=1 Tax=Phytophthora megakarya TaxID=4795 RepID=A0A225WKT7_9STRA|nr:reverse transcriptase [Phytophthora megakarya]
MEPVISVVKGFRGMPKVEYLGHKISHDGLEANPKDLSALTDLVFPDYVIYVSVLHELREIDYAAMEKNVNRSRIQMALASFKVLNEKNAATPILRHFDQDRRLYQLYMPEIGRSPECDQIYYPVMFASRTVKFNELNYGITEKEMLLLQILDLNYNTLVGRPIRQRTQHSTLD